MPYCLLNPKWPTALGNWSDPRLLDPPNNFCINFFFDLIIPSMRTSKIQNGHQGAQKWTTGSQKGSTDPPSVNKLSDLRSRSIRKCCDRLELEKWNWKRIVKIVVHFCQASQPSKRRPLVAIWCPISSLLKTTKAEHLSAMSYYLWSVRMWEYSVLIEVFSNRGLLLSNDDQICDWKTIMIEY